ncbi:MAG: hypothetical protein ABSG78_05385 [Verrucomicrobiota bacterium]|jgi:hypothetical protein
MSLAAIFQSRPVRRWRTVFRWVRITLLFAIFLLVAGGAYLHLIGLPDFLKQDLLDHLSERGFEVQFTSARLGWGPSVLVENAAFHRSDRPLGPRLAAGRTQIQLNLAKLLHRRVSLDALLISQGSLQLPFSEASGDCLAVNDVSLDLALLPNDTIQLRDGHASFHGIQMALRGTVTNFLAARKVNLWPAASATAGGAKPIPAATAAPQDSLRQFAATLDKIHFPAPPRLDLNLTADGRDPDTLRMNVTLVSDGVQTPWGEATGITLEADCARPVHPGSSPFVKARLSASAFTTPEARGRQLYLTADISRAAGSNLQAAVDFAVSSAVAIFNRGQPGSAQTNRLEAASLSWNGSVTLQPSPLDLTAASGHWHALRVASPWGSADSAALTWNATAVQGSPGADASWGFWAKINRWALDWQADLGKVVTPDLQLDRFLCAGSWRAPELVLTNLDAALYSGGLSGRARLDVASRELQAGASFDFEAHRLSRLLPPVLQSRLQEIQWQRPPRAAFQARVVLPSWTRPPPDWAAQLLSSLQLAGDFSLGPSSFRGFSLDSAQCRFAYSNQLWDIPRFHLVRPGGEGDVAFTASDETGGFSFIVDSHLDPAGLRPLLPEKQQPLLDEAVFSKTDPPVIHAEIRGRWGHPEELAVNARLAATNFTAHGEKVDGLETAVEYTNLFLRLRDARLFKEGGELAVPFAEMDWTAKKISLSNAVSTLDKSIAIRLLGAQAPEWLRVIGFDTPPAIQAGGSFVLNDPMAADLHFAVSGRNFRYSKLLAGTASGEVRWTGQSVALTNIQADLYDGTLQGWGVFDHAPEMGTTFRGRVFLAGIQLPLLMQGWSAKSNRVEGVLEGHVFITGGGFANKKSWTGSGHLSVNHALLWDIKLFGIFSPMLNAIIPGSGNNRAYQASADFVLTNGLLASDNLQIRSTEFRLLYHGTLNTEKRLDARVEAQVLRDFPILGHLFSWAVAPLSKLFEYKIGGTLEAPTYRPLYIPKALTRILEPFHKKTHAPAGQSPDPAKPPS